MNRGLNLPAIQKIMNDFEKESSMMDMKEEMMSDAVDDVMEDDLEDEEEGDKILKEVLDEIGVSLSQQVRTPHSALSLRALTPVHSRSSSRTHQLVLLPSRRLWQTAVPSLWAKVEVHPAMTPLEVPVAAAEACC